MSNWTRWRKIADRHNWFSDDLDWDGPACYELGIAGPRGGNLKIVYVGETSNEKRRVATYASSGSHLAEIIEKHLKDGWHLFYRAQIKASKKDAVRMQNGLLEKFDYDWNLLLNAK
jgi:hypothetical protein